MKKKLLTMFMVATMALSVSVTAYAKTGPEDYYDSYESSGHIRVGTDITPGEYVLFNKSDSKNATFSIRADGKTIISDSFWYDYIVKLDDDDDLYMANCYLVDIDEAKVYSPEEGFFKVGEHINPGTYYIEWIRGSENAQATIYTDLYYLDDDEYKNGDWKKSAVVSRGGRYEVELPEGGYIKLSGCRLTYDDED